MGNLNPLFFIYKKIRKGPGHAAIAKAVDTTGEPNRTTKVYVYSVDNFTLVNIFRSIRSTCTPI